MAQRSAASGVSGSSTGIEVSFDVAGKNATIGASAPLPAVKPQAPPQLETRTVQSSPLTKHQKRALTSIREERIEDEARVLRAALFKGVSRDLHALGIAIELELKRTAVFDQKFVQEVESKYAKKGKAISDEKESKLGKIDKELEPRRRELQAEVKFLTKVLEETDLAYGRERKGLRTKTPNAAKYYATIKPNKIFGETGSPSVEFDFFIIASHAKSALNQANRELAELKTEKRGRNGEVQEAFVEVSGKLKDRRKDEIGVGRGGGVLLDFIRGDSSTTAPAQVPVLLGGEVHSLITLRKKRSEREEIAARMLVERRGVINKAFDSSVGELRERNGERPAIPSNGHAQRECEEVFTKWLDHHSTHKNGAKPSESPTTVVPKAAS